MRRELQQLAKMAETIGTPSTAPPPVEPEPPPPPPPVPSFRPVAPAPASIRPESTFVQNARPLATG